LDTGSARAGPRRRWSGPPGAHSGTAVRALGAK